MYCFSYGGFSAARPSLVRAKQVRTPGQESLKLNCYVIETLFQLFIYSEILCFIINGLLL